MKYGSVCSGIEAASVAWEPLGWEAQWFSEIEQFPSAVLAHRFPSVPNLGDMTKLIDNKVFLDSEIDVLVGGTPCQSFSVAGLRKGLEDPRGNLMLTFLSLIDKKRPRWVVWENVPGVLSTNGGKDFQSFLDGLEELGYICDVEILDAQFFGVAQRRRRVFVCAQSQEDFLNKKTSSSALTIAQCLVEILHGIFRETLGQSGRELLKLEQANLSRDGVTRRMKLFAIATENCNFKMLQEHLIEGFAKYQPEVKHWDLELGGKSVPDSTVEDLLMGSKNNDQYILTEESLRKCLEDVYEVMKSFITLTSTNKITPQQIYICLKAERLIGGLICRLSNSSPCSLRAGLSFLMYNQEITNYARQASRELFEELDGVHSWGDIVRQTQHTSAIVGYLGDWRPAGAVLFEQDCLSGNTKKSREKRKATSEDAQGSIGGGSEQIATFAGNIESDTAATLQTTCDDYSRADGFNMAVETKAISMDERNIHLWSKENMKTSPSLTATDYKGAKSVCHAFKVRGGSEDNTGEQGGTPGKKAGKGYLGSDELAFTIGTTQNQQIAQPIPIHDQATRHSGKRGEHQDGKGNGMGIGNPGDPMNTLTKGDHHAVAQPIAYSFDSLASNSMKSSNPHSGCREVETSKTLDTSHPDPSKNQGGIAVAQPVPFRKAKRAQSKDDHETWEQDERFGVLRQALSKIQETRKSFVGESESTQRPYAIRRLTPFETEILQGFPRGWTKIPYRNKPADQCPDGPRYKACGNSMAVPVMRWIGQRIEMVEGLLKEIS